MEDGKKVLQCMKKIYSKQNESFNNIKSLQLRLRGSLLSFRFPHSFGVKTIQVDL